jgi:hypothetical protein
MPETEESLRQKNFELREDLQRCAQIRQNYAQEIQELKSLVIRMYETQQNALSEFKDEVAKFCNVLRKINF